jgi:hypothetical protein
MPRPPSRLIDTAGVWVTDPAVDAEARRHTNPADREAYLENCARHACKCFSAWINGETWSYSVKAHQYVPGWFSQEYQTVEPLVEEECDCIFSFDLDGTLDDTVVQVAHEAGRMFIERHTATGLIVNKEPAEHVRRKFRVVSN